MENDKPPAGATHRYLIRFLLVAALGFATALFIFALPRGPNPERKSVVERAILAGRANNEIEFSRLITKSASLWNYSDFVAPLTVENFGEFIGNCKERQIARSLQTVSVKFDCSRDARGEFIVDFEFCSDKVHRVSWPERGRFILSRMSDDILERIVDVVREPLDRGPPCPE
jgi:hypothetical protein